MNMNINIQQREGEYIKYSVDNICHLRGNDKMLNLDKVNRFVDEREGRG